MTKPAPEPRRVDEPVDPATDYADTQLDYYERAAASSRRSFFTAAYIDIALGALVAVLAPVEGMFVNIVLAIAGASVMAIAALGRLHKWHESWMTSRLIAERLHRELVSYRTAAGAYAGTSDPARVLVERVMLLADAENGDWSARQQAAGKDASK